MTLDIALVFIILLITVILFAFELFPVDKIAFFIIVSLTLSHLVTPEEAISGFSNSATISVLALMMLAIALEENGVINWMVSGLGKTRSWPIYLMAPVFMMVTAGISAFISTTAVVIVFIKIVTQLSEKFNISQSKLLLPISFAGILGGSCTLMGTSTNLIVNSVSKNLGAEPLGFFEFSLFGLIFLGVSILYLTIALHWLPWGKRTNLNEDYNLNNFLTMAKINEESELIGKKIEETFLFKNPEISILQLSRDNQIHKSPGKYITLRLNDELLLMCNLDNLTKINESKHLTIHEKKYLEEKENIEENEKSKKAVSKKDEHVFVELLMLPGASLLGKTLGDLRKYILQDAIPIAIKKRKTLAHLKQRLVHSSKNRIVLRPGDRLLVEVDRENAKALEQIENVVMLKEFDNKSKGSSFKMYSSLAVLLLVIVLAASGLLSILVSALTGVFLLLFSNILNLEDIYKKINWQIFFLLAGMIPLGVAMHNSGADLWISERLLGILDGQPRMVTIGLLFLITMVMSGVISNNATAVIMTPIAMAVAHGLKLDYKPFIMAIMFAANFSFFTPLGYQTNMLVYALGDYKFSHFFKIGGILSLILWILATYLLTNSL